MKLRTENYKKGAIYSSGFSVGVKFVAFIQNILIAFYLGAGTGTDIYFYLFELIMVGSGIVQNVTSAVLIPRSMQLRSQQQFDEERRYLNAFTYMVAGMFVLITGVGLIGGVAGLRLISQFNEADIHQYAWLLYILLPASLPHTCSLIFAEILASHKYFTFPQFVAVGNNLLIIACVVLFHRVWGVASLAIGFAIGACVNFVWLLLFMKRHLSWRYSCVSFTQVKKSLSDMGAVFTNHLVIAFASMFPLYMLSMFYPGTVTVVTYAHKLLLAPVNLFTQLFAVLQIKLSELYAANVLPELRRTFLRIGGGAVGVSIVGAILFYWLRAPIIELFFGHGAMTPEGTRLLIDLMGILIVTIPFIVLVSVASRLLYAVQRPKSYSAVIIPVNLLTCLFYALFIRSHGTVGYAYSDVLSEIIKAVAIAVCLYYLLKKWK
ncbi:MAG: hypothetical protein LBN06_07225 [Prevotellaceae bacterium]|jgi:peptidoglycan biosynthesis protein MviN/MurJ (putative lipid II flippase)|nr:hypothetical protein [Prevotellaceae bacterium]